MKHTRPSIPTVVSIDGYDVIATLQAHCFGATEVLVLNNNCNVFIVADHTPADPEASVLDYFEYSTAPRDSYAAHVAALRAATQHAIAFSNSDDDVEA